LPNSSQEEEIELPLRIYYPISAEYEAAFAEKTAQKALFKTKGDRRWRLKRASFVAKQAGKHCALAIGKTTGLPSFAFSHLHQLWTSSVIYDHDPAVPIPLLEDNGTSTHQLPVLVVSQHGKMHWMPQLCEWMASRGWIVVSVAHRSGIA
jgi:hypothetical protein